MDSDSQKEDFAFFFVRYQEDHKSQSLFEIVIFPLTSQDRNRIRIRPSTSTKSRISRLHPACA